MPKTVIDIGKFREVMTGARPPKAALDSLMANLQ